MTSPWPLELDRVGLRLNADIMTMMNRLMNLEGSAYEMRDESGGACAIFRRCCIPSELIEIEMGIASLSQGQGVLCSAWEGARARKVLGSKCILLTMSKIKDLEFLNECTGSALIRVASRQRQFNFPPFWTHFGRAASVKSLCSSDVQTR